MGRISILVFLLSILIYNTSIHIAAERQVECLLRAIDTWGLKLATPLGATIWQRGTSRSTIDLIFMDEGLYQRLKRCNPEEEWALALDYIPI
jgi:hypothetical protein